MQISKNTQNREAKAVICDIKIFENLPNSLTMLKLIIQSENDIENGQIFNQDEMFEDLEKNF